MKRKLTVLLIIVLSINIAAIAGDDKKAIAEVIEKEYQAYVDKDLDAWSSYWVHEPYVTTLHVGALGYSYVTSFDSLKVKHEKWIQADNPGEPNTDKKIKAIHISGDLATVFLDEIYVWKFAGEEEDIKMKSTYVLEKVDENWKLVSMTTFNETSYENNDFISEWRINFEGYQLLNRDELDKAIKVFEMNTRFYPESFNTWDSLAEAYLKQGDDEKAIEYYKKSLELNSKNDNARKMLEKIEN